MAKFQDLTGRTFGQLTVLSRAPDIIHGRSHQTVYHCRCSCGVEKDIRAADLKSGKTISCGCSKENGHDKIIGQIISTSCGLRSKVIAYHDSKHADILFEDGSKASTSFRSIKKNTIAHPKISHKLTSRNFCGFTDLKPAFRTNTSVYYYCVSPDGKTDVLTLQEIMQKAGIKPAF